MRHDSIQHLLAKRQEGTLTDSELEELNRLTRKDEVIAAAEHTAAGIVRRRRLAVSSLALVAVAVGAIGITLLLPRSEAPLVAQQQPAPQPVIVEELPQTVETPAEPIAAKPATAQRNTMAATPAAKAHHDMSTQPAAVSKHSDPTVMCNNQCEADSVINDIWKFLTA